MTSDRLKIVELTINNVQCLRAVHIRPDERLQCIGGRNGQGKTSVLRSIAMALGGAKLQPGVPIRVGQREASVEVGLGRDGQVFANVELTLDQSGRHLKVTGLDGSPQAALNKLLSSVSFSARAFANMEKDKQRDALKSLVGLDFAAEERARRALYDERTEVGRRLANVSERLTAIPLSVLSAPDVEESFVALSAQKDEALRSNHRRAQLDAMASEATSRVARLTAELAKAQEDLEDACSSFQRCPSEIDLEPINARITAAEDTNRLVRAKRERAKLAAEAKEMERKAATLTRGIEEIDEKKTAKMAAAKWPIPGLGFDDDGVTLNGLPFDQASAAARLRVSLAIGEALNPRLRVILDDSGEKLDDESMELVRKFAEERDMQVILERVGTSDPGAIIIEDGEVAEEDDSI